MTNSLVTGGAGFIGSHIVRVLLARGDDVKVLDNFSTGKRANLAGLEGPLEIVEGDLRDTALVADLVKGVDRIFHHAAFVSVPLSMEDPGTCFDINVHGTANLLEIASQAGVKRVVLASSAAVYGDSENYPLSEDEPLTFLSPYAASKQTNESYANLYSRVSEMRVTALRYFNIYGPRQSPDSDYAAAIPIFARLMMDGKPPVINGDGYQSRDFVFVSDVVRANLLAAEHEDAAGKVYNICSGHEITILDLVNTLAKILPQAPDAQFRAPRPGDIYRSLGDPSLAGKTIAFETQVPLLDGLRQTVAWMQA
ncbi:MAG: SDR family oxidoreductase [Chloroflexota bacterium]